MINNEDFRKVDRTDKVQELTDIWHREIVATRRWLIAEVYGEQIAKRYTPMTEEREFFVANGRLPHPEDFRWAEESDEGMRFSRWNQSFWDEQRKAYPEKWEAYQQRAVANRKKWAKLPGTEHENERLTALEGYIENKLQELKK